MSVCLHKNLLRESWPKTMNMLAQRNAYQKLYVEDANSFGRIGVLYGGVSQEREVSINSGRAVLDALLAQGYDAIGIDIGTNVVQQLSEANIDRAFIALHGAIGENGKIQALLELLEIPYAGSGVLASALSLHKLKTKCLWQQAGLPTAEFAVLSQDSCWVDVVNDLSGECFVKPVSEGSSIGMRCVDNAASLEAAYVFASQYDSEVIAERRIVGREFSVTVLNGVALPAIELKTDNEFYDYDAKYVSEDTEYFCPCDLSVDKQQEISQLALEAFSVLGCAVWGRIDFMQDAQGNFYLLEANTVPGMTTHSLVPMAAKVAGLSLAELVLEILNGTL